MIQVLPELQIIQVGLWDCSNAIECSRKVAGDGGNRIRIAATVDGFKERLSEVLGRSQETIEGLRQAFEDVSTAPVAVIDLDRVQILF